MVRRPGREQGSFTAGVIGEAAQSNLDLAKYLARGLKRGVNIEVEATGAFRQRDGLRVHRTMAWADYVPERLFAFIASDGLPIEISVGEEGIDVWWAGDISLAHTSKEFDAEGQADYSADQLAEVTWAQYLDTGLLFHPDVKTKRLFRLAGFYGPEGQLDFNLDFAPFVRLPNWNYGSEIDGDPYANGVAEEWTLQFVGLTSGIGFYLTVSGARSPAVAYTTNMTSLRLRVIAALNKVALIRPGYAVTVSGSGLIVTFSGAGNEGDEWAVSGTVINAADAAVIAFITTIGVKAGEAIVSADRGWPRCGLFYQQRLILGGMKYLPNAWMASRAGEYWDFDPRIKDANGAFVAPLDIPGGESIEMLAGDRNLLVFTNTAGYYLQDKAIDKTRPPAHVPVAEGGGARAVAVVSGDNATFFVYSGRGAIGEIRYTDLSGNFTAQPISLVAADLVHDITRIALRRPDREGAGGLLVALRSDGTGLMAKLLRDAEVTAFTDIATDATFLDIIVTGDNRLVALVERGGNRRMERFDPDCLLDGAVDLEPDDAPGTVIDVSDYFADATEVWAIAGDELYGPIVVDDGSIELPEAVEEATVGTWSPPIAETLPDRGEVTAGIVVTRKGRIHSVHATVKDTTSIAIGANGAEAKDVPLRRFDEALADAGELAAGFTGNVSARGIGVPFGDWPVGPTAVITQLRPGRLKVKALTLEDVS